MIDSSPRAKLIQIRKSNPRGNFVILKSVKQFLVRNVRVKPNEGEIE